MHPIPSRAPAYEIERASGMVARPKGVHRYASLSTHSRLSAREGLIHGALVQARLRCNNVSEGRLMVKHQSRVLLHSGCERRWTVQGTVATMLLLVRSFSFFDVVTVDVGKWQSVRVKQPSSPPMTIRRTETTHAGVATKSSCSLNLTSVPTTST